MSFKFDEYGVVKPFQGNTLLCQIPQETIFFDKLLNFYRFAKLLSFYSKITLLPSSSYHVTVMNCCHEHNKEPGFWPKDLSPNSSMTECNEFLTNIFKRNRFYFGKDILLKVDTGSKISEHPRSINVVVEPLDIKQEGNIRKLREQISELTGLTDPSHDSVKFHITLAYINEKLTSHEVWELQQSVEKLHEDLANNSPILSLGAPEFTLFEDMFYFRKVCSLNN